MTLRLANITLDCDDTLPVADKDERGHRWTVMADVGGNEFCVGPATA